jgi:hypothetical protein
MEINKLKYKKNSISFNAGYELGLSEATKEYQAKIDMLIMELCVLQELLAIKDSELKMLKK